MTTYTMRVASMQDHDRILATLTCEQEHDHSVSTPGCDWYGQWLTYQSAAIGEGRCPAGCGRLDPDVPRPENDPRDAGTVGGWCTGCRWWWATREDAEIGIYVSQSRPTPEPRPFW